MYNYIRYSFYCTNFLHSLSYPIHFAGLELIILVTHQQLTGKSYW